MNLKTQTKTEFKIGDYVQVANVGTGKIVRRYNLTTRKLHFQFVVNYIHDNEDMLEQTSTFSHISLPKLIIDLKFFAECERRGLPIPQTEIYLYNPFFDTSPMFNKKTGKRTIPKNTPKRHDYFWADKQVSLEIDGGTFGGKSGHNTGVGIGKGMDKSNWCAHYAIRLLRFTPQELFSDLLFKHLTHLLK